VERELAAQGYQPYRDGADTRLRNCPFHVLADRYPPLICGMNLALLEGLLAGAAAATLEARLDPRPGDCCVALREAVPVVLPEAVPPSKTN
jgi:predicted ArsR family transcriptional regulator